MLNGDAVMEFLNVVKGSRGGSKALLLRHKSTRQQHKSSLHPAKSPVKEAPPSG